MTSTELERLFGTYTRVGVPRTVGLSMPAPVCAYTLTPGPAPVIGSIRLAVVVVVARDGGRRAEDGGVDAFDPSAQATATSSRAAPHARSARFEVIEPPGSTQCSTLPGSPRLRGTPDGRSPRPLH